MNEFAKILIFFGFVLIGAGLLIAFVGWIPGLGKFPGDIYYKKGSFVLFLPITTCALISLILTLIYSLFGKR